MYHISSNLCSSLWLELLKAGLRDDGFPWDWTTLGTRKGSSQKLKAKVIGKSEGIWAAETLAIAVTSQLASMKTLRLAEDGKKFKKSDSLFEFEGDAGELLAIERPFLNLAAYVSGIATSTHRLVKKVKKACPNRTPRICLTRKTLPGYRDVAIHGVRMGGGFPHRVSLSGGVLIKENHIAAAGGIQKAVSGARQVAPHGLKVEIEVRNEKELKEALEAKAEGLLLDNFSPLQVQSAIKIIAKNEVRPFIEVSGGLNESNIEEYSIEGVDVLSVGSITHSVQAVDLSLLVYE